MTVQARDIDEAIDQMAEYTDIDTAANMVRLAAYVTSCPGIPVVTTTREGQVVSVTCSEGRFEVS